MAAPSKRRRKDTPSSSTPSKRLSIARGADKAEPSPGRRRKPKPAVAADPDKLWTVRSIQAEKGNKYLIDWEDDPVTGESYAPTWVSRQTPAHDIFLAFLPLSPPLQSTAFLVTIEFTDALRAQEPKANANKGAVDDWERQKRRKAASAAPANATAYTAGSTSSRKRRRTSKSDSEPVSASASTANVAVDDPSSQEPPSKRARLSVSVEREPDHRNRRKRRTHSSSSSSRSATPEAAPAGARLAAEPSGLQPSPPLENSPEKSEIEDSYIPEEVPNTAELRVPISQVNKCDGSGHGQPSSAFLSSQTRRSPGSPLGLAPIAAERESPGPVIRSPELNHCGRSLPAIFDSESAVPDSQGIQEAPGEKAAPKNTNDETVNAAIEEEGGIVPSISPVNSRSASGLVANASVPADRARASESPEVFNSSGTSPPSSSDTLATTEETPRAATEGNSESSSHPQPNESGKSTVQTSDGSFQSSADSINQSEQDEPEEPPRLTNNRSFRSATDISYQDRDTESHAPSKPISGKSSSASAESTTTRIAGNTALERLGQEGCIHQQTEGSEKARLANDANEGALTLPDSAKRETPQPTEVLRPTEVSQPKEPPKAAEVPQQVRPPDPSEALPPADTTQPVGPPKLVETPRLAEVPQPTEVLPPVESSQPAELSEPSEAPSPSEPVSQPTGSSRAEELPRPEPPLVAGALQQVERSEPPGISQPVLASEQVEARPAEDFQPLVASQQVESPELVENLQSEGDSQSVVAPQLAGSSQPIEAPRPTESSRLVESSRPRGHPQRAAEPHPADAPETSDNLPPTQPSQQAEPPQPPETHHPDEAFREAEASTSSETLRPTETFPPLAEVPRRESPQPIETPLQAKVPHQREDISPLRASQQLQASQPVEDEPLHPLESHQPVEIQQTDHSQPVEATLPIEPSQLVKGPQPTEALQPLANTPPAESQQIEPSQIVEVPQSAETVRQTEHFQAAESPQNIELSLTSETLRLTESHQPVEGPPDIVQGTDTTNSGGSVYYQAAQKVSQPNPVPSPLSEELDIDQDIIFQTQVPLALSTELGARRAQSEEPVVAPSHQIDTQSGEPTVFPISPICTASHSLGKGLGADRPANSTEGIIRGTRNEESAVSPVLPASTEPHHTEVGVDADQLQNPVEEDTLQAAQVVSPPAQPVSQALTNDGDIASSQPSVSQRLQRIVNPPVGHPVEIHEDERSRSSPSTTPNPGQISPFGPSPESLSPLVHASPEEEKIAQLRDPRVVPGAAEERIPGALQDLHSSPPPLPVTHPVERYDNSPPSQPLQASSDKSMSDGIQPISSPPEGLSLREKLNNIRASTAAKRVVREEESRLRRSTVSPVGTTEAQTTQAQPTSTVETVSPSRPPRVKSPAVSRSNDLPLHKELSSQVASSIAAADPGEMEFVVPLPMNARVRDQYQQIVYNYREGIEAFVRAENESNVTLVSQMKEMLRKVSKVAIHPDLDSNDTIAPQGVPEIDEAKWSESCSAKFEFLRRFLEAIRYKKIHVAILAQSKRLLDILELFLKATQFKHNRPDRPDNSRKELTLGFPGQVTVTLQETGESGAVYVPSDAQLVVAFDRTFNPRDRHVETMRNHPFIVGKKCPVFHLLIQNSVEHADMCIPPSLDEEQRLQTTVYLVTQARHDVGVLPAEYPTPTLAAEKLANWLLGGGEAGKWPLPSLGSVRGVEFLMDSQASDSQRILRGTGEPPDSTDNVQNGQKRPLVDENNDGLGPQKKPRSGVYSPVQNTGPGAEAPHVSDSTADEGKRKSTGSPDETRPATDTTAVVGRPKPQVCFRSLQSRSANPQQQVGWEAEIQQEARSIERRLREYIENFTELQTKYEDQVQEMRSLRAERDNALAALKHAAIRRDQMTTEILKLKEERASVEALLKQARADLIGSSRPGVAELAKAREEARGEAAERRRLEQKVESMTRDLDFFRAQYQEASSAAVEARSELHILRNDNEIFKRKASGEAVKLRQMATSTENEMHLRRILELEAILKERNEHLRRKEEEVKSQARGKGIMARRSSTPRSPKPSRAGSPNPPAGNVPAAVTTAAFVANNGGYGHIPGVGAAGRGGGGGGGGGHPLRYSGHPLPTEQ
ncbi:hypothetical protein GP486_004155 [Trichoglossum hirsutum]|uniref:Chromo domain-containing protein n=1 Tax=Trichoglossum hirsutum TaxID=265104 RepID=A0A9P8LBM3_9PEZI|nr:hypothetical protein GP486_004155 [Trichoglossum hirsutum]